tara:strand:+ start:448 stop:657 length:210 start_codon:yes stop_codon:yes gene_type:complete
MKITDVYFDEEDYLKIEIDNVEYNFLAPKGEDFVPPKKWKKMVTFVEIKGMKMAKLVIKNHKGCEKFKV